MPSVPALPSRKGKRSHYYIPLKSKRRIEALFKDGRKVFGRYHMLRFMPVTETLPPFRVVFAVSNKIGTATRRNRVKRRLREALYLILKQNPVECRGFDLAILPRAEILELPFGELMKDLQSTLRRLPQKRER